ncbi:MAG: hypothetical protein ABI882_18725, partial [Acidobacteriota bacterium]
MNLNLRANISLAIALILLLFFSISPSDSSVIAQQPSAQIPSNALSFGAFTSRFNPDGTFMLEGEGWPAMKGTWKISGAEIELLLTAPPAGCEGAGRYRYRVEGARVSFEAVSDECRVRKIILNRSAWVPSGTLKSIPVRRIVRTAGARPSSQPN